MNNPTSANNVESLVRRPTSLLFGKTPEAVAKIRFAIGNSSSSPETRRLIRRARSRDGYRLPREGPLTEQELYLDDARPSRILSGRLHHICSICNSVKVHPVAYLCGHSHCFTCVRLHLERDWKCPILSCGQVMHQAPHRHYPEEQAIAYDFPEWVNTSRVSYSWEGLIFPLPTAYRPDGSDDEI
ncbi:hypothetical protein C8F04DRAFT_1279940 [Mycena alexandri]|uniref:RING-type domain-containing protein n=1 Tax=Mycena alexandri TaxID=1745969 RepID=A0AAD6RXH5_9AGAR|nr:hypothetical protein C8F04DRAFT_1279940 [Mycena alexandri]